MKKSTKTAKVNRQRKAATNPRTGYEVNVTSIDFDADEESTETLGVFFDKDEAEEAKIKDMLKHLETDFVTSKKLTKDEKDKAIAAFKGELNEDDEDCILNGYTVVEDELYDQDETHCCPNYAWDIVPVKVK